MKERDQSRVASVVALLIGIWVAISPIWLSVTGGALVSTIVVGCVIAVIGFIQFFWSNVVPSWIMGVSAVWLFISMFVFGTLTAGATLSGVLSAIVTFMLAIWDGAEQSELASETHHHVAV